MYNLSMYYYLQHSAYFQFYIIGYNFVTKTVVTEIIPYGVQVFLTFRIIIEIKKAVKNQLAMRCTTQSQKEEMKSTKVVVRGRLHYVM